MVRMKVYSRGGEVLVAACDSDLVGKKFTEGKLVLDVCDGFYGEKEVTIKVMLEALAQATIGNLTGKDVVDAAADAGFIDKKCVLEIDGVPHAQICRMG